MFERSRRLLTLPFLALSLALSGCESGDPASPTTSSEARFSTGGDLTKVAGTMPAFSVSQEIGLEGGLIIGATGYALVVPPGAVAQPTVFTFESLNKGYPEVKLTATAVGSSDLNDVGSAGFLVPLTLSLSTQAAISALDGKEVTVVWVRPDGTLERMPSSFDAIQKVVAGKLDHFSQYGAASN